MGEERMDKKRKASEIGKSTEEPSKRFQIRKQDDPVVITKWTDMRLKSELLNGLISMGFERPSAIQQRAIMPIIMGRDVICQSQSGTGKTAVFCLGALQVIRETSRTFQALLLAPTRELAEQTGQVLTSLSAFTKIKIKTCVGGKSLKDDVKSLKDIPHIISGTPGRIYDLVKRGDLETNHVGMFVVDEADEMISSGLKNTIYDLFREIPNGVQVVLVSATMSAQVMEMSRELLSNPVRVLVKREEVTVKNILQYYSLVEKEAFKIDELLRIFENIVISQAIIFCNTKKKVDVLQKKLKEKGFTSLAMHGEMIQKDRDFIMQKFRAGSIRILITTDVLGRGIDVQQVSLVINYDLPQARETYVHRIGRSGRWGRKGLAISLCLDEEKGDNILKSIEKFYKVKVSKLPKDITVLNED